MSEEEKRYISILAAANHISPGTAARQLVFRGLAAYLQDGRVTEDMTDADIRRELQRRIDGDSKLKHIEQQIVEEMEAKRIEKEARRRSKQADLNEVVSATPQAKVPG